MVFSSLIFLFFFLPMTLLCYYLVPQRALAWRNVILLLFGLLFYAWGEPKMILVLLLSILLNYGFGLLMDHRYRRFFLALCVFLDLANLFFFKYLDFFIQTTNRIMGIHLPLLGIVMPIGISFYTFQAMSYVVDVYRGEARPQKNPLCLALYISMFPQLVAGPIVRYCDIEQQLSERGGSFAQIADGIPRFIYGLAKKVLLANALAKIADHVFMQPTASLSAAAAWLGIVAYTLQIYFDFSGYSDMAIGLGKMFGFTFLENFNLPYVSQSITEFWRRWHMSLSTWFRDYVYIPLGGNRCSKGRHILNLLIVWGLTGFWHGANYTFLAWGLYFAIWLIVEKYLLQNWLQKLPAFLRHAYALLLILLSWVLFRSEHLSYALGYWRQMFHFGQSSWTFVAEYLVRYGGVLLLAIIFAVLPLGKWRQKRAWQLVEWPVLALLLLASTVMLLADGYNPFLYFRF